MSGKIILNLAISLDGYIADEDGGFNWIVGQDDKYLDTEKQFDFSDFLKDIDVVVMGKECYNQGFYKDYKSKKVYVATSHKPNNHDNINFINGNIVDVIKLEKEKTNNIFLFGGGGLVDNFIKADEIDEYIIGIIPIILGKGKPLFLKNNPEIKLHLDECLINDGITILRYSKRKIN
ncbi:dihydrofolate reductase [Clostridium botulinum]|uniref:dihydrofolate reductase family protein n=1 Tax=Clostridium botulinum TaxID=1491 RepID=UPI0021AE5BDC|nr:dihydrofolate reductase family protein [Clostridium botulinum]UZP02604.1 dihydrofolate reductase [Clostridium botulinum]UZP05962.1 dihydrofolate reductase [Clostridium botulinum]UZP09343.1 dihydrofolate reductase [Clostridium botulinum]